MDFVEFSVGIFGENLWVFFWGFGGIFVQQFYGFSVEILWDFLRIFWDFSWAFCGFFLGILWNDLYKTILWRFCGIFLSTLWHFCRKILWDFCEYFMRIFWNILQQFHRIFFYFFPTISPTFFSLFPPKTPPNFRKKWRFKFTFGQSPIHSCEHGFFQRIPHDGPVLQLHQGVAAGDGPVSFQGNFGHWQHFLAFPGGKIWEFWGYSQRVLWRGVMGRWCRKNKKGEIGWNGWKITQKMG